MFYLYTILSIIISYYNIIVSRIRMKYYIDTLLLCLLVQPITSLSIVI